VLVSELLWPQGGGEIGATRQHGWRVLLMVNQEQGRGYCK
jgi:hypothetical protein